MCLSFLLVFFPDFMEKLCWYDCSCLRIIHSYSGDGYPKISMYYRLNHHSWELLRGLWNFQSWILIGGILVLAIYTWGFCRILYSLVAFCFPRHDGSRLSLLHILIRKAVLQWIQKYGLSYPWLKYSKLQFKN